MTNRAFYKERVCYPIPNVTVNDLKRFIRIIHCCGCGFNCNSSDL